MNWKLGIREAGFEMFRTQVDLVGFCVLKCLRFNDIVTNLEKWLIKFHIIEIFLKRFVNAVQNTVL